MYSIGYRYIFAFRLYITHCWAGCGITLLKIIDTNAFLCIIISRFLL